MTAQILQHLESLQLDLAAIDPARASDAADRVASIAAKLREAMVDAAVPRHVPADSTARKRAAA